MLLSLLSYVSPTETTSLQFCWMNLASICLITSAATVWGFFPSLSVTVHWVSEITPKVQGSARALDAPARTSPAAAPRVSRQERLNMCSLLSVWELGN